MELVEVEILEEVELVLMDELVLEVLVVND